MTKTIRGLAVAGMVALAGCATGGRSEAPAPGPSETETSAPGAPVAEAEPQVPAENPCADPDYLSLRRRPPQALNETEQRMLADMENACIDYRLALARARSGESDMLARDGADYRREVFPWVAGISIFTGVIYLFTSQ